MKFKKKVLLVLTYLILTIFTICVVNAVSEYKPKESSGAKAVYELDRENVRDFDTSSFEFNLRSDLYSNIPDLSLNASSEHYIVEMTTDGFCANKDGVILMDESLNALIEKIECNGEHIHFNNVYSDEPLNFTSSVTLSGELTLDSANVNLLGNEIILLDFNFLGNNGSIRVKGGETRAVSGSIKSVTTSAIILDFYSGARFVLSGAEISSESTSAALVCEIGSAELFFGKITNIYGAAVENKSSLFFSKDAELSGLNFDVITDRPPTLLSGSGESDSSLKIMYRKSFADGSFTVVLHGADERVSDGILIYDLRGEEMPTKYFEQCSYTEEKNVFAVYLPHSVKFYCGNTLYTTGYFLSGEAISEPDAAKMEGYTFGGWYKDILFREPYVFGVEENCDLSLYAAFTLTHPEFSISSLEFTYDAKRRILGFDYLYHPLMDKGDFSFVWYKNSTPIENSASVVSITDVNDSGDYFCKLTFSYCGDFVVICTPIVSVSVQKMTIEKPKNLHFVYTGEAITPQPPVSPYYTFEKISKTDVGTYSFNLVLNDFNNLKWSEGESDTVSIGFEITKAENEFLTHPSVSDTYEADVPKVGYKLKFGVGKAEYSEDGIEWSETAPTVAGKYYLRISAEGTENYSSVVSEKIEFTVHPEFCTGIKIDKYPTKTEYRAFEIIDLSGAEFTATYNSGKSRKIDIAALSVTYKSGRCFLVTDSSVTITFEGNSVPLPVTVITAEYDVSSVVFEDCEAVYNGMRHTIAAVCEIIGKDGIPLSFKINGGGIDVGTYPVTLSFSTDSINYTTPHSITKNLVITPLSLSAVWENTEFIYDGAPKLPSVTVVGAQGVPLSVLVSGDAVDAGEYIATVALKDSNYSIENTSAKFIILKADFDLSGVTWNAESFVYCGEAHTVFASGLPSGITVLGYANSSFTEAGSYTAEAALSYDEKNYNPPKRLIHNWEIKPADYNLGTISFEDAEFVFDGNAHYPTVSGTAPVGYDGSVLLYSFSDGVTHVSEGRRAVSIIFESVSKNYNTPAPMTAYVTIIPKTIEIVWENLSFVYDGFMHLPTAKSGECKVKITGYGIDAGEYVAKAEPDSSDYKIENSEILFKILRANNSWITELKAEDIYETDAPKTIAKALSGTVSYKFYRDEKLTDLAELPLTVGMYYAVAEVQESKNYNYIISEAVKFSVLEILPIEFKIELREPLVAMKKLTDFDFFAYLLNNNGSTTTLSADELIIEYQSGSTFLASDGKVKVSAYGFSAELDVIVLKSTVDIPILAPVTYNGEVRLFKELISPLFTTDFSGVKNAGEYEIRFTLTDPENYEFRNGVSSATLTVRKAPITLSVNKNGSSYDLKDGVIYAEDELFEEYYEADGKIYLKINNSNYDLTVIPREDSGASGIVLIVFLLAVVVILAVLGLYIAFSRMEKRTSVATSQVEAVQKSESLAKTHSAQKEIKKASPIIEPPLETLLAVDETYANSLISDLVAKSLIGEEEEVIETDGKRRYILNLDTISDNFAAGETVNINDFKKKGLLPDDAKYVKILARGVIDKPINISANSFSLPAVKMIALTGGTAKRVRTVKRKI